MSRLLSFLLTLTLLSSSLRAADPAPAALPEKVQIGDSSPSYPAERARRVETGKALLDRGDLAAALQEFEKAETADPIDPMPYFYKAVVYYRQGDFPEALRWAKLGRDQADENEYRADKPDPELAKNVSRLKELYETIKAKADATQGKGNAVALLRSADEAYTNGLLAKAAAGYAEAYRADPSHGDVGLKAATLFADRLKNPLDAARLWQQIVAGGEPHATAARAEQQSHRDVLDALLNAGLAKRDQWRSRLDETEPLRLAEAFPESAELQIELAVIFAKKGPVEAMIKHLQAASRLGLTADDFLARKEFIDYLQQIGGTETAAGKPFASFVRDAYGEDTLTAIRTDLKRRADEVARIAREKFQQAEQARVAKELRELNAWRQGERQKAVQEINALLGNRNGKEVEILFLAPLSKYQKPKRNTETYSTFFSYGNGMYEFRVESLSRTYQSNGRVSESSNTTTNRFSSAATFTRLDSEPSTWTDSGFDEAFRPEEAFRLLCRSLIFRFNGGIVYHRTVWHDPNPPPTLDMSLREASVKVLITEQETARARELFMRLAQLDQAGDNVEKLRQLR
jgi:hypothetical protein